MKMQNAVTCGISTNLIALMTCLQALLPLSARAEMPHSITISQGTLGEIRILFHGLPGEIATLQTTKGLGIPDWRPLAFAVVQTNGVATFTDIVDPNSPGRFYRVAVPREGTLVLRLTGEEDELFTVVLPPTNSLGATAVAAYITELPARGQLFQFDGVAISTTPAIVTDSSGRVQFRAARDENGTNYAAFRFMLRDAPGSLETGEATLDVNPVPDAPINVFPLLVQTDEDTPVIFQLQFTDADLQHEGDAIRILVYPPPVPPACGEFCSGTLYQVKDDDQTRGNPITTDLTPVINPRGLLMFVPAQNSNFDTSAAFYLEDSYGLQSRDDLLVIRVTAVNDTPTALDRTYQARNTDLQYPLSLSFDDIDHDALEVRFLSLPATGQLFSASGNPANTNDWLAAAEARNCWYHLPIPADCAAPIPIGSNIASFSYIVRDPSNATASATASIDIVDFNVPPVPTWPTAVTNAQNAVLGSNTVPIIVHLFDRESDYPIHLVISQLPQHGRLYYHLGSGNYFEVTSGNPDIPVDFDSGEEAVFHYVPEPNFNTDGGAPDSFRCRVSDGLGLVSRCEPTVLLHVKGAHAPSFPFGWSLEAAEDTPVIFQLPIIDADLEQGGDTIRITIIDPIPCISLESRDCLGHLFQVEDDDVTRGTVIDQPDTLVTNPRGLLMFVPKANANGGTVFLAQLEDSYGLRSPSQAVWVLVRPVNDPPEAISRVVNVPNTTRVGFPISPPYYDVDVGGYPFNDSLRLRFVSLPERGRLLWGSLVPISTNDWVPLPAGDLWVYELPVPDPNDCTDLIPTGTNITSYSYMLMDSSNATAIATDRIDILDENIPPMAMWPVAVTNREDTTFEMATNMPIVIHLEDRDGDRVFFFIARPPEHGRLYFQHRDETWGFVNSSNFQVLDSFYPGEHPRLFYVPDPGFHTDGGEPDSFSFRIVDWQLHAWRCEPVVKLYVTHANKAPVVHSQTITTEVGSPISVILDATDADGDAITFSLLSLPIDGVLAGTPPSLTYIPNPGFTGIDSFEFSARDDVGATSMIATVTIHVSPVCAPRPAGLTHWWRGENNALDSAATSHGTLEGGLGFIPGKVGTAFHFDGADDQLLINAPALATDWTAVFWVNRQDSPDASAALLMDSTTALKLEQYGSMNRNVGITQFGVADHKFNYTVPASQWTHLAFVGTGSGTTLYVNGAWQDALPVSIALPLESLGGPAGDRLKGWVDEIAVFKRALTSAEIQQLHDAGSAGMCVGLP